MRSSSPRSPSSTPLGSAAPPERFSRSSSLWGPPWYGHRVRERLVPERAPWASLALGGVQLALFFAQRQWGEVGSAVLLRRMGAAWGPVAWGAEAWRLVSAGFVFRDGTRLALHLAALLLAGVYVEGLLGPSRWVLLYVTALGVSQAAHVGCFPEALGVGSTGALWGLAGALGVLVCHPRVPVERSYRVAPGVAVLGVGGLLLRAEWGLDAASVGVTVLSGLAVGMVLALTGVLTWRAPRYLWRYPQSWYLPERPGVVRAAWAVAVLTAVCVTLALLRGRPWTLRAEQTLVRQGVSGTPVSVAVPSGAALQSENLSRDGESVTVVYGEAWRDPLVVTVGARRLERAVPEARLEAETQALSDELRLSEREPVPLEDVLLWTAPSVERLPSGPVVYSSGPVGHGFWDSRWVMYRGRWRVSFEVRCERGAVSTWHELMEQMARNVEVDEP